MLGMYILNGRQPVPVESTLAWAKFFETTDRQVSLDRLNGCVVSTVFLGLDHSFFGGPPLLFETMIFGINDDSYQVRYSTWGQAERGHQIAKMHLMTLGDLALDMASGLLADIIVKIRNEVNKK